ncbi:MAG: hypothetical protein QM662_09705 [Gordonia sp. (in: high G+C Gram-positive bacteria)]
MDDYRRLIQASIERPTDAQIARYALTIANDHSWYKHLSLLPPGEPFFIYLSPHMHQIYVADGRLGGWRDLIEAPSASPRAWIREFEIGYADGDEPLPADQTVFLHRWAKNMTTAERRERFGGWTYRNPGKSQGSPDADIEAVRVDVPDAANVRRPVPDQILRAGLVYLTGTVSPTMSRRAHAEYEAYQAAFGLADAGAETRRQRQELITAMERVRALLWP